MAQQTAVEWLVEQIIKKHPIITQYLPNYNFDKEIIEQAKEMEKQQIVEAYRLGHIFHDSNDSDSPEEYYKTEYGKQ